MKCPWCGKSTKPHDTFSDYGVIEVCAGGCKWNSLKPDEPPPATGDRDILDDLEQYIIAFPEDAPHQGHRVRAAHEIRRLRTELSQATKIVQNLRAALKRANERIKELTTLLL